MEMRLAETDARIKIAAQDKIRVQLLEDQLNKLRNELAHRGVTERNELDLYKNHEELLNHGASVLHDNSINSFSEELSSLREENISLKNDVEVLKAELSDVKNTDERVLARKRALIVGICPERLGG